MPQRGCALIGARLAREHVVLGLGQFVRGGGGVELVEFQLKLVQQARRPARRADHVSRGAASPPAASNARSTPRHPSKIQV